MKNEFLTHRFTWISKSAALGWCVTSSCPDINPNISSVIKLIWVVMCVLCSPTLALFCSRSTNIFCVSLCVWVRVFDFYFFYAWFLFILPPFFLSFAAAQSLMDVLFESFLLIQPTAAGIRVLYFIALWSKYPLRWNMTLNTEFRVCI